jgi:hypothetical protein
MNPDIVVKSAKGYKSVSRLLATADPMFHVALAEHIAKNGIYRYSEPERLLKWCAATSDSTLRILLGISWSLEFKLNPPSDSYLDWYMEQDPCYHYGWPTKCTPKPTKVRSFGWVRTLRLYEPMGRIFSEKLCTFGRLLALRLADTASIAKAIGAAGFWGFDELGRLEKITKADHRYKTIEKALSDYHAAIFGDKFPDETILRNTVFARYGWLHNNIPTFSCDPEEEQNRIQAHAENNHQVKFGSINAGPPTPEPKSQLRNKKDIDARLRKSYDIVICGLLAMVRGEIAMQSGSVAPPGKGIPKQNQIIENLLDSMSNSGEISDTNIREKFGAANKYRSMFGLDPLRDDG